MRHTKTASWLLALALPAAPSCEQSSQQATQSPAKPSPAENAAATPTPEPAPAPAEDTPSYEQAGDLQYAEVMLGGAKQDDRVPMIVAIHGLGDAPENFAGLFETFPEPARLILPRGIDDFEAGGYSWFPLRARDPDVEALAKGIDHAADVVADGLAAIQKDKATAGDPIVTGFSQGGMVTFALAIHHPETVGSAVPVGGWLPPPLWPKAKPEGDSPPPPVLALHGTADNAVLYESTAEAVEHLTALGYPVELKSYEGVGHVITPAIQRDMLDRLADATGKAQGAKEDDAP